MTNRRLSAAPAPGWSWSLKVVVKAPVPIAVLNQADVPSLPLPSVNRRTGGVPGKLLTVVRPGKLFVVKPFPFGKLVKLISTVGASRLSSHSTPGRRTARGVGRPAGRRRRRRRIRVMFHAIGATH